METMLSCLKLVALGALTVGPSVGWLVILSAKNEVQRIPKGTIVALFVLIALLIWPIATMEHHVNSINPFAKDSFLWQCFRQFLSIAFNEEFGKLVLLLVVTHLSKRVDTKHMTMICAMAVALGFAAWENVYYVINVHDVFRVALVRMCFCVPSHMSFGIWMGYFYGLHRLNVYKHKPVSAAITLCLTLVVPIVLHGCYNLLVGINMVAVLAFNAVLLAISLRLVIKTGENDCALNPMSPTVIEWQYEDLQWSEQTNLT